MLDSALRNKVKLTLLFTALLLGACSPRTQPADPLDDTAEAPPQVETLEETPAPKKQAAKVNPPASPPPASPLAARSLRVTSQQPVLAEAGANFSRVHSAENLKLRSLAYIDSELQDADTESYDPVVEGSFFSPVDQPLSTFSIDVDTASYANARRFIEQEHRLPPAGAVRIEELLNYFTYDYPDPNGQHPFSVVTEVSEAPWNRDHRLVHIGLQGQRLAKEELPENNLVFLIDVSGSMQSPNKLPLLKRSFGLMVEQLDEDDTVAIVVYAGSAGLVLPPTPGSDKATILASLEALEAGGSTAGGAGLQLAYDIAKKNFIVNGNNRVVLATDGDFNVGASSDAEMVRLIEAKREAGIDLSVLGFGTGNYQDSKMEKLAKHGNGNAAYIDSLLEAKKVLVTELGGTLVSIARDVKIQVEFNPAVVKGYRLVGYENRRLAAADFNDDTKDAGELGAGHSVTALYDVILTSSDEPVPTAGELRYQRPGSGNASGAGEMLTVKLRYKFPETERSRLLERRVANEAVPLQAASDDFRFSAAVAEVGLLLVESQHRYDASWTSAIELARGALATDEHGYRQDFVALARKAELLSTSAPSGSPGMN